MNEHGSITQGLSPRRKAYDITMRTLLYVSAAIICALLVFLIGYILYRGSPSLSWQFLTSEESVIKDIEGILPAILNTVYVIIATLIFILPHVVANPVFGVFLAEPVSDIIAAAVTATTFFLQFNKILDKGAGRV